MARYTAASDIGPVMALDHATDSRGTDPARPSHAIVRALAEHALGSSVTQLATDHLGASNAIYFVTFADREQFVLRVSPVGQGDLVDQELWALNQARALGVPVPEVVFADTTQCDYPAPYMIMRRLPGESAFRAALTPQERAGILTQLGRHLRTIHGIPIAGAGYLESRDGAYSGRSPSWWTYVQEEFAHRLTKLPPTLLSTSIKGSLEHQIGRIVAGPEPDQAVLLHGDYQFKNFLVQDRQVTGIVDFENLLVGDPAFDFCALHYWSRDPATTVQHLLHGYGKIPSERTLLRRLYFYELSLALEILWWENHFQNRAGLQATMIKLKRIIATIEQL
jgi:aminoglycoside phosphotransferase (APT) family kinase protein